MKLAGTEVLWMLLVFDKATSCPQTENLAELPLLVISRELQF